MEISQADGRITLTLSLSLDEFTRALADGELRVMLAGAEAGGLSDRAEAGVRAVCAAYGPETLGANTLWEIAQAGAAGIGATQLRALVGVAAPKQLAGVFSGLAKVMAREMPGAAPFITRAWQGREAEFHYSMAAPVRAVVLDALG